LVGAIWAWADARRQSPWLKLRQRIARELARLGIEARPSDTLGALALRLREQRGASAEPAAQALLALDLHRYGRPGREGMPPGWWRGFRAAIAVARAAPAS
jgi:hypothetical protein